MEAETILTGARWNLLKLIANHPRTIKELAELTNTSMANIVQQLRILELAGVVRPIKRRLGRGKPSTLYTLGNKAITIAITPFYAEKRVITPTPLESAILRLMMINDSNRLTLLRKILSLDKKILSKIDAIIYKEGDLFIVAQNKLSLPQGFKRLRNAKDLDGSIILYTQT